jgi:DNA-binding GntR family transcriptional regulator
MLDRSIVSNHEPPSLAQLRPSTLREQARANLRASIITGEIPAGVLFSVGTVAERLGVSATPIREALSDLSHSGLVVVVRNRGFVVPELTEHDLDEIFELRLLLEVPAVERLTGRLSTEDLAARLSEVERGIDAATTGDLPSFLEADREFHLRLLASLGNARLVATVDNLRDQARLYGLSSLAAAGRLAASAEEHRQLLAAIEANNPVAAREQMTLHLKHTRGIWAGRTKAGEHTLHRR